jgi:hypothetical protein
VEALRGGVKATIDSHLPAARPLLKPITRHVLHSCPPNARTPLRHIGIIGCLDSIMLHMRPCQMELRDGMYEWKIDGTCTRPRSCRICTMLAPSRLISGAIVLASVGAAAARVL